MSNTLESYKKVVITDWEKNVHTYDNVSFFVDDNITTTFKWRESPETAGIDASWKDEDYQDILKIPV